MPAYAPHREQVIGSVKVQLIDDQVDWDYEFADGMKLIQFHRRYGSQHGFQSPAAVQAAAKQQKATLLPLYLYEHGLVRYSLSDPGDPWDSGQVGYIWLDKDFIRSNAKARKLPQRSSEFQEALMKEMKGWLDEYTDYCNGSTYAVRTVEVDDSGVENGDDDFDGPIYGYDHAEEAFEAKVAHLQATAFGPPRPPSPGIVIAGHGFQPFI